MKALDDRPLHRMFSSASMLIPVSIEIYVYRPAMYRFAYLYVFGIRIARWNLAPT